MPGGTGVGNLGGLAAADQFKDPTAGKFQLKPSAALYGAGATLAEVPNDITGRRRSVPTAIGAHQNPRAGALLTSALI